MTKTTTRKQTQICAMWRKRSKEGKSYFTGMLDKETFGKEFYLKGFINGKKKNPNEPDIRIYESRENELEKEVIALWQQTSDKGVVYFTGKVTQDAPKGVFGKLSTNRLVGFVGDHSNEKAPYFRVYLQEDTKPSTKKPAAKKEEPKQDEFEEDLPF